MRRVMIPASRHTQHELDRLVWADSFTVDLDGVGYRLQGTSKEFVRSAAKLVHLPAAVTEPDIVISAVLEPVGSERAPVLSLYVDREPVLRTLSSELLLQAFLSQLRGRALAAAADRVFLQLPAVRIFGAAVLLPEFALSRLVSLEGAAARWRARLDVVPALTIDLKCGRPVPGFAFTGGGLNGSSIRSIDAIAVRRTLEGGLPSRALVVHELAQSIPNLRSVGAKGLEALGLMVEQAQLIEWDEIRPQSMIDGLAEKFPIMNRAG